MAAAANTESMLPPALTAEGTILGTCQYMAPEQIEGLEADARTDIFAFGALLFEMLTGRPAFEGNTRASLIGAILKDEPPPVSRVQPVVPAALDRIISTCLAKNPDDRYQSARDLVRDLTWVASGSNDAVRAPTMTRPAAIASCAVAGGRRVSPRTDRHRGHRIAARQRAHAAPGPTRFTIAPPENASFGGPAVAALAVPHSWRCLPMAGASCS